MAAVKWNQDLNAGQDWMADINLLNEDGSSRNVINHTFESKIKRHYKSVAVKSSVTIQVVNAGTGNIRLRLSNEQTSLLKTGKWLYDVEMTNRTEPVIQISGDGNNATAYATVASDGSISAITVSAGGTGYTEATTITIADPNEGGTTATATATVSGGLITAINITDAGSNYPQQTKERVIQGVITIRPEITTD